MTNTKPIVFKSSHVNSSDNINPNLCPLCHESNDCGNVMTCTSSQDCWCNDPAIQFSKALLNKVPAGTKGKTCICKACALKHQ